MSDTVVAGLLDFGRFDTDRDTLLIGLCIGLSTDRFGIPVRLHVVKRRYQLLQVQLEARIHTLTCRLFRNSFACSQWTRSVNYLTDPALFYERISRIG